MNEFECMQNRKKNYFIQNLNEHENLWPKRPFKLPIFHRIPINTINFMNRYCFFLSNNINMK